MILTIILFISVVVLCYGINKLANKMFWEKWEKYPLNFEFRWFGKKLWYSRAVAVVGCVFYIDNDVVYVLANQRGTGTPDNQGRWNAPCGYLEWNESCERAVVREIREETGMHITSDEVTLVAVNSNPEDDARENVTFRYGVIISKERALATNLNNTESEKDEVTDIQWIRLENIPAYTWAFNHNVIIPKVYEGLKTIEAFRKWQEQ